MNVFRLAGDVSHLLAIIILFMKIWRSKSCAGISGKSQVLFALVFTTRYLDLFTVFISAYNTVMKILWTFSIYLESVAILPQLFMITKTGEAESITTHYLFFLGLYRALYLANWVWRYHTEAFFDQIAVVSGVVQTIFYCDFFYLYFTRVIKGSGKMSLPMPV
ncbi:hypothetical protein AMELA_G00176780 [Ameiurus melas]|uniref:ER lumen protein-retaining receptor n=1 Tax=Ameiurus melas TaxID=219545 RepID=A0A7J6ADD9_AMEME|nr:hypothetical protein AMELA_G00176780 [Ameiurus melas]